MAKTNKIRVSLVTDVLTDVRTPHSYCTYVETRRQEKLKTAKNFTLH